MDISYFQKQIKGFLDDQGRLHSYPAKRKRQIFALFYLASKFEPGVRYTEKAVNQILLEWHTFDDWATLRRDLCDARFLNRESNGSFYWLEAPQPTLATFGFDEPKV